MAFKDLSHLPTARDVETDRRTPDRTHRFGHLLAQRWADHHRANPLPRAHPDARFRHSDAGNCARAIGYAALDLPESNPIDLAGFWVIELGHMIHQAWQETLPEAYPGAEVEVKVHEGRRAGHVDAVVKVPRIRLSDAPEGSVPPIVEPWVIAIEGKSVGGYKYQLAVGAKGDAQGPSDEHVAQAAMNGLMLNADEVVVVYWSRDAISIQQAERKGFGELARFTAEWTFSREEYEPIAQAEIARIEGILGLLDEGVLPARIIPGLPRGARVVQPRKGAWVAYNEEKVAVGSGTAWQCAYCRWQDVCDRTSANRMAVSELRATAVRTDA